MIIQKAYNALKVEQKEIILEGKETIVENINRVISYIQEHKVLATKGRQYFAIKHIKDLNAILIKPLDIFSLRPMQRSYPNINGIYLILRTMGMLSFKITKREIVMSINEELFKSWNSLNTTEQYFTLLENWLIYSKPNETIEASNRALPLAEMIRFFTSGSTFSKIQMIESLSFSPEYYNLALAEMFGFIDISTVTPTKKVRWNIVDIKVKPLVKQILELLKPEDNHMLMQLIFNPPERGYTKDIFNPYCKDYKQTLHYPLTHDKNGIFRLKISLGKVYRTIDISSEVDFENLASIILELFNFDNDHLYEFRFINNFGQKESIKHPEVNLDDGKAWAYKFYLKDLPLEEQNSFTFIFDFGDWWEFDIFIEKIEEGKYIENVKLLKSVGEAPEQYPDYEEW